MDLILANYGSEEDDDELFNESSAVINKDENVDDSITGYDTHCKCSTTSSSLQSQQFGETLYITYNLPLQIETNPANIFKLQTIAAYQMPNVSSQMSTTVSTAPLVTITIQKGPLRLHHCNQNNSVRGFTLHTT